MGPISQPVDTKARVRRELNAEAFLSSGRFLRTRRRVWGYAKTASTIVRQQTQLTQASLFEMEPPDTNAVGLLSMAMAAVGVVGVCVAFALIVLISQRLLPQRRSRLTYWLGVSVLLPATLALFFLVPKAIRALAVLASFGWEAYTDGLRVVNKHGLLSDGRYLGVFWTAAVGAGKVLMCIIACIPLAAWHAHYACCPKVSDDSRKATESQVECPRSVKAESSVVAFPGWISAVLCGLLIVALCVLYLWLVARP